MDKIITNMCSFSDDKKDAGTYRLGDHILGMQEEDEYKPNHYFLVDPKYKDTILGKFIPKIINKDLKDHERFKIASKVIKEMMENKDYDLPSENDIIVHLRLGDVFDLPPSLKCCAHKRPDIDRVLTIIKKNKKDKKKIVFVTAFSFGPNEFIEGNRVENGTKKSKEFMQKIIKSIPPDMPYEIRSSVDVDSDFIYLTNAKNLVVTSRSSFAMAALKVGKFLRQK